jgi:hypothetical protein
MSEQTETQQPKTPRKGSRPNRTTTGSEQNQGQGQSRRGGGRRGGRGNANQQQQRQTPELDGAPTQEPQGDFDEQGNFVFADNASQQGQPSGKKRSNKKPVNNMNYIQEVPVPAPQQQLPFPTLRGTPHKPYAGPTFHASPAASALPMPRFFSKSVPNPASAVPSLQERAENESAENQATQKQITPEQSPIVNRVQPAITQERTESPLDFFFSAARAEKAKQHLPTPAPSTASESPIAKSAKPAEKTPSHWASIYGGGRPQHQRNFSADSSKGLFMMELDGSSQNNLPISQPQAMPQGPNAPSPPASMYRAVSDGVNNTPFHRQSPMYSTAGFGVSTPVLPSEMEGTPAARAGSVPVNHQSRPNPAPRSAGSTPFQTPPPSNVHSQPLHYGNRNLSPMFQAARNNSPRNQSQLRREVGPDSPTAYANELPGSQPGPRTTNGFHNQGATATNANAAAQKYLSDMISRASANSSPHAHGYPSTTPRGYSQGMQSHPSANKSILPPQHQQAPSDPSVARAMEDDLRRMLKISENWYGRSVACHKVQAAQS